MRRTEVWINTEDPDEREVRAEVSDLNTVTLSYELFVVIMLQLGWAYKESHGDSGIEGLMT